MLKTIYLVALIACVTPYLLVGQSFEDKTSTSGFDAQGKNRGIAIGDFDGDGLEDIYVSRLEGANLLYRNLGDFAFEEVGQDAGVDYSGSTTASVWFDLENDGDLDLFLGNLFEPNILYRNNGGTFEDISDDFGIGTEGNARSVNAVDYDNDGDLDIYVAQVFSENILWRNESGVAFTDVTSTAGITDTGRSLGAVFFDYDLDGDQDIYQTRDGDDPNLFWRNNGDGTFTEISAELGLNYIGFGMGADVADLNGDGRGDIYLTNLEENKLYLSNAQGSFTEVSASAGVDDIGMGWSTIFFDCNNNGLQDLYLSNDSYFGVNGITDIPNRLFMNNGDGLFTKIDVTGGIQNTYGSYGAAVADFDGDGRLDLVIANSGNDGNQIFRNTSDAGNHVAFRLKGRNSNPNGIGARVELYSGDQRQVDFITAGSGYASQNTSISYFGIGDETAIDSAVIYWPSGTVQRLRSPLVNTVHEIEERSFYFEADQVVWTDPPFPTQSDDVTVYFNAEEGNGALAGFDGDVYAHTGVITSQSSSPTDWKNVIGNWGTADSRVLMTREEENIYSLSYNIQDFYGISQGVEVEQMAFVFRNVNGSIVGRDTDGSDIYTDVYPAEGLLVSVTSPLPESVIALTDSLLVNIQTSVPARIEIFNNNDLIFTDSTDLASFYFKDFSPGENVMDFVIAEGTDMIELEREYYVVEPITELREPPVGIRDGLNRTDSSFIFQLYAPGKAYAFVFTPANSFRFATDFQMYPSTDTGRFWLELPRTLFSDETRTYQYMVDGAAPIGDPYSEVVLDPNNDQWVSPETLAELPPYPEGATGIVTVFDLDDTEYDWQVNDFERPAIEDLVIYELLIRDFLNDRSYASLIDTLDYLERLGVNAIELMPIHEFEGNDSWGYNPSYHLAVDKYYGSRDELRRFIDEAHARGIAVILDVVFNHTFGQGPLAQLYWDVANFRPTPDNPWLNVVARHPFNVGYDFNHESEATKYWTRRNLEHWLLEYRFDGFRLDLSKGLTQRNSGNDVGFWSNYDASRIAILKDYCDHAWSIDSTAYMIMEHFAANDEEKELAEYGMLLWGNMNHEFSEATMGFSSSFAWADYRERDWSVPHLIAYMESHDEERLMYRALNFGDASGDYNTRDLETALRRIEAVSALFYTMPGPKMLWEFGELGFDYSINWCTNGTVSNDCRLVPKPVRWDYLEDYRRERLFNVTSALIHLKTEYPTFSTTDYDLSDGNFFIKRITLRHPDMDAFVIANYRVTESNIVPNYPYEGVWYDYLTGDSIVVDDLSKRDTLAPGEYHVYTSKRITPPNGVITATRDIPVRSEVLISPNPVFAGRSVVASVPLGARIRSAAFINMAGQRIPVGVSNDSGVIEIRVPNELSSGVYLLELTTDELVMSGKVVVLD